MIITFSKPLYDDEQAPFQILIERFGHIIRIWDGDILNKEFEWRLNTYSTYFEFDDFQTNVLNICNSLRRLWDEVGMPGSIEPTIGKHTESAPAELHIRWNRIRS